MGGEMGQSISRCRDIRVLASAVAAAKKKKINQHTSYKAMRSVCASECVDGVNDRMSRCLSG